MKTNPQERAVSKAALMRIPAYLRYFQMLSSQGREYVSSSEIASDMQFSAVAVRKDLALVSSVSGKPKLGFPVRVLIGDLERFMGYYKQTNAVVVGAGGLGRAILCYEGFPHYGIHLVGAFDVSPDKIGAIGGKPVYPMERLKDIVKRESVSMCVLTVPREAAQSACDQIVEAGIRAVLCFAPVYLRVPEGVLVRYEDIAASLASLNGGLLWT